MNGIISVLLLLALLPGLPARAAEAKAKTAKEVAPAPTANDDEDDDRSSDSEVANILNSMGYPELQVVPRASERLRIEAKEERGSWFYMHWPVQLSGLSTLVTGLTAESYQKNLSDKGKDEARTINMFTTAVGTAWIAGGLTLGAMKPYASGYRAIGKPGKDERQTLLRERLAEESIERPARVMRVLRHVSVATNFSMNVLSGLYLDDKGKVIAGVGAVLAFLPYMFEDHSVQVHDKHIEYKKKIYTPIKGASIHVDQRTGKITPLTTLAWTF